MRHYAWCAALMFCVVSALAPGARADTLSISFSELESYARDRSSRAEILQRQLELIRAERDEALAWSNPELGFDREDVVSAENQYTIAKSFDPPWSVMKERSAWSARVAGAESAYQYNSRLLLSDLKSLYVKQRLQTEHLNQLQQLEDALAGISGIAAARQEEGHLSQVDEALVRLALASLYADRRHVIEVQGDADAEWRALTGIEPDRAIRFVTEIPLTAVALEATQSFVASSGNHPGVHAHENIADYYRQQAGAARGRFVPRINLYGGYKTYEPELSGYVVGVSLAIPLFHRNGAAARQHTIQSDIAGREAESLRIRETARARSLVRAIADSHRALRELGDLSSDTTLIAGLVQSYSEGWIDLHEFLSSVQIGVSGLRDFYQDKAAYYKSIFELESIIGTTLVEFTTEEK